MSTPTTEIRKAISAHRRVLRARGEVATIDGLAIEMLKRSGSINGSKVERYQDYSYRELKLLAEVVLLSGCAA